MPSGGLGLDHLIADARPDRVMPSLVSKGHKMQQRIIRRLITRRVPITIASLATIGLLATANSE